MPRCPHCGAEIYYLYNYCSEERKYRFEIVDGKPDWDNVDYPTERTNDYCCPECLETITTDDEEAEKFLRGEQDA